MHVEMVATEGGVARRTKVSGCFVFMPYKKKKKAIHECMHVTMVANTLGGEGGAKNRLQGVRAWIA